MNRAQWLFRQRGGSESSRVGPIELFFDLVFVFAVTQLSHTLLADISARNAVHVGVLLLAVWWVWIYTSWVTNWLDPERWPVRVALFVLMLAGLLLSVSIPQAFAGRGLLFASAFVSMQVGRTLFVLWAVQGAERPRVRNFQRILAWLCLSGGCWIAGGLAANEARLGWWALALALDLIAPLLFFWVPGLGRSLISDWDIDGSHMAERCSLFIIIALGESLLVTGATFGERVWSQDTWIGFLTAVLGTILMWWIYFDTGAERAHRRIKQANEPGRQARSAYTYLHVLIVAGIIVSAVGDEIVLVHPRHASPSAMTVLLAGPACYLVGTAWFKWVTNDRRAPPFSHLVGLALLLALAAVVARAHWSPLAAGVGITLVLALVATWEAVALRRR